MTPHRYEQSDFISDTETLREYRRRLNRLHPLPAPRDAVGFFLMGLGGALTFLGGVWLAYLLVVV